MKRYLCILTAIVILFSAFSFRTLASETIPLTTMNELGDIDYLETYIDYTTAGHGSSLHYHPGEDAMRYFMSFFTDENLLCINDKNDTNQKRFSALTDSYYSIGILGTNGITNAFIEFDKEKIWVYVHGPESLDDIWGSWKKYEGWFTFKDPNIYELISERWKELKTIDTNAWNEAVDASQKNKNAVTDIKILYRAKYDCDISNLFSWGLISFVREGETTPRTAFFMEGLWDSDWSEGTKKVLFLSETIEENNTLTFNTDRVLGFAVGESVGKEYDANFGTIGVIKAQIFVNADGQLEEIYLTLHSHGSLELIGDVGALDLSTVSREYGTFPAEYFSVNAQAESKEEETKTEDTEKTDFEETENKTEIEKNLTDSKEAERDDKKEVVEDSANENTEKTEDTKTEDTKTESELEKEPYNEDDMIILEIGKKEAIVFGRSVTNDVAPKLVNNRTMLPIRFVAEALGGTVSWDQENRRVSIVKEDINIEITIGSSVALVNGERKLLDTLPFVENERTYLPLRFVAENLGVKDIIWNEGSYVIKIVA